jgi:hypothetical protein
MKRRIITAGLVVTGSFMSLSATALSCAATLAALLIVSGAQAALMDFETLEHTDFLLGEHGFVYVEDGFQLDNLSVFEFSSWGTLHSNYTGSTALFNASDGGDTQLTRFGGGVFDLVSIDLAEHNLPTAANVTFLRDGGHSQTFTLDGVAFGAETFFFDNGFLGATIVTWEQEFSLHQFDNIVVNPVPIPAAVWLFGSALGLLAWMRRRKTA